MSYQAGTTPVPRFSPAARFTPLLLREVLTVLLLRPVPGEMTGNCCPFGERGAADALVLDSAAALPGHCVIDGGFQFSVGERGATSSRASRHWLLPAVGSGVVTLVSLYPLGDVELDHCEPDQFGALPAAT